jgi:hypothetical protein
MKLPGAKLTGAVVVLGLSAGLAGFLALQSTNPASEPAARAATSRSPPALANRGETLRVQPSSALESRRARLRSLERGDPARGRLVLWFLHNHPDDPILNSPYGILFPDSDADAFEEAHRLWGDLLGAPDAPSSVLANGVAWDKLHDRDRALVTLDRLQEREPDEPRWRTQEAHLHLMDLDRTSLHTPEARARAEEAVAAYGAALPHLDPSAQGQALSRGVTAAALAGQHGVAGEWGEALLDLPADEGGWHHFGHQGLGLSALGQDDVDQALEHLAAMGAAEPGPVQTSFGPSMLLAYELLQLGHTEPVLAYLDQIVSYWEPAIVADWRSTIEAGGIPDFGANLRY